VGEFDARAWGYEWLGPVAVRVDALEAILAALSDRRLLERTFEVLGVDAAMRGVIVKHASSGRRR